MHIELGAIGKATPRDDHATGADPRADTPPLLTFTHRPETTAMFLFVPGLGGDNSQWRVVEEMLTTEDVAIAYLPPVRQHPGLGPASPRIGDVAEAAAQEIAAGGFEHVVVIAHSVGSFVAFDLAARVPKHIAAVVAVNGALTSVGRFLRRPVQEIVRKPSFGLAATRLFVLDALPAPRRVKEFVVQRESLTRLLVGSLLTPEMIKSEDARRALAHGTYQRGVLTGLWANRNHWTDFESRAGLVTCPVILVTGTLDPLSSIEDSNDMAALFVSAPAAVEVLVGVGHAAPVESPGAIAAIVNRLASPREPEPDPTSLRG